MVKLTYKEPVEIPHALMHWYQVKNLIKEIKNIPASLNIDILGTRVKLERAYEIMASGMV